MNTLVPEETEHGDMPIDVYQKLANNRILFICDHISDQLATDITANLFLKDLENSHEKITLFINSDGGDIRNVFMICDMINLIAAPVETVCIGVAADEAALILASGAQGMRLATKNSVIAVGQLHHDWTRMSDLTDAKKAMEQSTADNKKIMELLAKCTQKTTKEVSTDFERRVFMTAPQAVKYGLVDKIVTPSK